MKIVCCIPIQQLKCSCVFESYLLNVTFIICLMLTMMYITCSSYSHEQGSHPCFQWLFKFTLALKYPFQSL